MQAIFETVFHAAYLISITVMGMLMIRDSKGNKQFILYGIMVVSLAAGDSFHLVPRVIALNTTGLQDYTVSLDLGKLVTSVTMTTFYILLYHIGKKDIKSNISVYTPFQGRIDSHQSILRI